MDVLLASNPVKLTAAADPVQIEGWAAPDNVGNGLTASVTSRVNAAEQFGVALVMVIPVICKICPLLAYVNTGVVKLAAPDAFANTPEAGV